MIETEDFEIIDLSSSLVHH